MAKDDIIWANLLHLSLNLWIDREQEPWDRDKVVQPYLRFDMDVWRELTTRMANAGMNMVVLDLGDAIRYESHPEIAVEGAWSTEQLRFELARLRELGLEPIPKLNFSACHDAWMGQYARMLSTDIYYGVCRDLIAEVIALFDKPRFFHLGMDEETYPHQEHFEYVVCRQYDLWWHDLLFYVEQVEKAGVRPWIWSDYVWHYPELFFERMPKSVLQSNWYYYKTFGLDETYVKAYLDLEEHGYDQIPTGSNWSCDTNFADTVKFAREHIAPERLTGFFQTTWQPTTERWKETHIRAIEQVAEAKKHFETK